MASVGPGDLERFRPYLVILARLGLDRRLRGKVDSSDIGQQTFTQALQKWRQFHGQTQAELKGWLRAILASVLHDQARLFLTGEKRNVGREKSLQENLKDSSARLERCLGAKELSPSERVLRQERLVQLTKALGELPEEQRTAVELHYLGGLTVPQVADELRMATPRVVRLLRLGLKALRGFFSGLDSEIKW